jgi:hypothetical protein
MRMYGTAHRAKSKLDLESQRHLWALRIKYPRRYQFKSYRQYALAKRIWRKERRSEPYEYQHEN